SARPETSSHHHSPCLGQTTRIPNGRSHRLFRFLVRASRDLWAFLLGEGRFPRHSHLSPEDPSHPSASRSTRRRVVYQGTVASAKSPPISELGATTTWYRTRDRNHVLAGWPDGSD